MAEFVLHNIYFEFNGKVKQQVSGIAIGTKFAPAYTCIFMERFESEFFKSQEFKPLILYSYIDDMFFIYTHRESKLELFFDARNKHHLNIKFIQE